MNRALVAVIAGLGLAGLVAVGGLIAPLVTGYPGGGGGQTISEAGFDRTRLAGALAEKGFALGQRAHVRIFKREHLLELWLAGAEGRFRLFRSYAICAYSGGLGPKLAEGDRQAPEGFYRVRRGQLNSNSRHHRAFNIGFPNELDRALGRTGSYLMVHGGCSSIGCYAMTDAQIDEIYAVLEAALAGGQEAVDVSIFPFRLSEAALEAEAGNRWLPFWRELKQGFDLFEAAGAPPAVAACEGRYVFGTAAAAPGCTPIAGWA